MALGAIGLNTHIKDLLSNGIRPILLGLGTWFVVALVSLGIQVLGIFGNNENMNISSIFNKLFTKSSY